MNQSPIWPIELDWRLVASELAGCPSGVVLAVDRRTGRREEIAPEFPARIARYGDLDADKALVVRLGSGLKLKLPARYGLQLNWVGEPAPGKLDGELGIVADGGAQASVEVELSGALLAVTWPEAGRLRLCLRSSSESELGLQVCAGVNLHPQVPDADRELILGILGSHPLQWLRAEAQKAGTGRMGETAARFFSLWENLESHTAAAIWKAAGDVAAFEQLRTWVRRIAAEPGSPEALETALPEELSATAEWIEAVAGSLWDAAASPDRFARLRAAAQAADKLLSEDGLVETLGELKRRASEQAARALEAAIPDSVREFVRSVREKAALALGNKLTADLSYRTARTELEGVLFDGSFAFCEQGLAAWRAALAGDLTPALSEGGAHVRLHLGVLTHGIRRHSEIELNLPFMNRKQWASRLEALASVRIEPTPDGRLLGYQLAAEDELAQHELASSAMSLCGAIVLRHKDSTTHFSLGYSDVRRMSALQARSSLPPLLAAYGFEAARCWLESASVEARQVEVELGLWVPGEMVAAWLEAPVERSPNYGSVYTEVSVAVQQAMRRWLPYVYFSDLSRYETLGAAYPLVVYQCTLPFRSKAKNEFAYDVMSAESVAVARRSTGWALGVELARIEQLLVAAGKPETARFYRPSRKDVILASVERAPRLLNALLVADALFIDHLIGLGVRAGGLRQAMERKPQRAVRELARFGEEFVKTFHRRLRRLYGGQDFVSFGSLILVEATQALNSALRSQAALRGVCRLRVQSASGGLTERAFVNAQYQPR